MLIVRPLCASVQIRDLETPNRGSLHSGKVRRRGTVGSQMTTVKRVIYRINKQTNKTIKISVRVHISNLFNIRLVRYITHTPIFVSVCTELLPRGGQRSRAEAAAPRTCARAHLHPARSGGNATRSVSLAEFLRPAWCSALVTQTEEALGASGSQWHRGTRDTDRPRRRGLATEFQLQLQDPVAVWPWASCATSLL